MHLSREAGRRRQDSSGLEHIGLLPNCHMGESLTTNMVRH